MNINYICGLLIVSIISLYLNCKSAQNNRAEDRISKNAVKHIPLAMNLAGVDLVEKLHHDKSVEDDGVMFRWRRVQRCVPATVDVKELLAYTNVVMQSVIFFLCVLKVLF